MIISETKHLFQENKENMFQYIKGYIKITI